jgi:RIO kinase 1
MHDPLETLLTDGFIEEVCARLKSGKEADLWLVRHGGEIVAAKIYKDRQARSFRNNSVYKEGRQVRDTRTQRAMLRGSRFGQAAAEEAWKSREADALHALHAAGVRVPRPVLFYEGVLLMELVVDAHGQPAPRLVDAHVTQDSAAALYADLRGQVVRMLTCDLIHGDLSPYNVLLGREGPVVIDFPQVVGAAHNGHAESFLQRDLQNLHSFFAGIDPALRTSAGDAREIWRAYVRRELTPEFVPSARLPPHAPPDRRGRGERHRPRRQGAAPRRDPAQPEQPPRAGAAPSLDARRPARAEPQARQRSPEHVAGRGGGRGRGKRHAKPAPEVIHVARPSLGPAGTPPEAPPRAPAGASPARAPQRTGESRSHHRRRRRRHLQ